MKTENAREFSVSPKSLRAVVHLAGFAIMRCVGGSLGNSLLRKQ
jgi:hypothetical protein